MKRVICRERKVKVFPFYFALSDMYKWLIVVVWRDPSEVWAMHEEEPSLYCTYNYGKVTSSCTVTPSLVTSTLAILRMVLQSLMLWDQVLVQVGRQCPRKRILTIKFVKDAKAGDGTFHKFTLVSLSNIGTLVDEDDMFNLGATWNLDAASRLALLHVQLIDMLETVPVELTYPCFGALG